MLVMRFIIKEFEEMTHINTWRPELVSVDMFRRRETGSSGYTSRSRNPRYDYRFDHSR